MMDTTTTIDILNELLAVEGRCAITRVGESVVFVSAVGAADLRLVQQMARECRQHMAWLASLIVELGGAPRPTTADITTADLHFEDLPYALHRMYADMRDVVHKYQLAVKGVAGVADAAATIQRILRRHEEHDRALTYLTARAAAKPGQAVTP